MMLEEQVRRAFRECYGFYEDTEVHGILGDLDKLVRALLPVRAEAEEVLAVLRAKLHPEWHVNSDRFHENERLTDRQKAELTCVHGRWANMRAYAFLGLLPSPLLLRSNAEGGQDDRISDVRDAVCNFVAGGRALLDALTPQQIAEAPMLVGTIRAAEARLAIDLQMGLTPQQMVALAGAGSGDEDADRATAAVVSTLPRDDGGRISAAEAQRWLSDRPGYHRSMWLDHLDADRSRWIEEEHELEFKMEDVILVSVAEDGSVFDAKARDPDGFYTIGAEGCEERIADYRTALAQLSCMAVPRWRRANAIGYRGLVQGVTWDRRKGPRRGRAYSRRPRLQHVT